MSSSKFSPPARPVIKKFIKDGSQAGQGTLGLRIFTPNDPAHNFAKKSSTFYDKSKEP
jgi:hypothetical protein